MVSKILRNFFGHKSTFFIRKSKVEDPRFSNRSASSAGENFPSNSNRYNADFRYKTNTTGYNSSRSSTFNERQKYWTAEQLQNVLNMLKKSESMHMHSIAILPNVVHQNRQDQTFVDRYLKDWWNALQNILQPNAVGSGHQRVKGYASETARTLTNDQLSIAMNGLRKINEATNGQAFQIMTWPNVQLLLDHVLDDKRVAMASPFNLNRTLQSILYIAKIFRDDPRASTWRQQRTTDLLRSFLLEVYAQRQSRFSTTKHTRGILTKLCLLLPEDQPPTDDVILDQLTRLCYNEMDMTVRLDLRAPAVMNKLNNFAHIFLTWNIDPAKYKPDFWTLWFELFNKNFRHMQEQRNPGYCWLSIYQCLKIALEFNQSESFGKYAKGLWLQRVKEAWTGVNQRQVRELIRLVENQPIKFDDDFLLVELKHLLKDDVDNNQDFTTDTPDIENFLAGEDSDNDDFKK